MMLGCEKKTSFHFAPGLVLTPRLYNSDSPNVTHLQVTTLNFMLKSLCLFLKDSDRAFGYSF